MRLRNLKIEQTRSCWRYSEDSGALESFHPFFASIFLTPPVNNLLKITTRQARKLSEELGGIICKDCGNCKCGDDHSKCPGCVEACRCTCTAQTVSRIQHLYINL